MASAEWLTGVQAALDVSGLGDERAVVAIAVEERGRGRRAAGGGGGGGGRAATKLAVLALTVDSASAARLHQFNRNAESIAQVPKLTQLLAQCTRSDDASESPQAFEMSFGSGGASSTVLAWLAESEDAKKEFLWCCLHICSLQRRMPASNVDFIDLSLWSQANGLEEIFAGEFIFFSETTLLYYHSVQLQLLLSPFYNLLFDSVLGNEAENLNFSLLPNTMSSILGLQIGLWIPVTIIKHDNISSLKIDAKATSSCR